jgi:hypothetical protein
LTWDFITFESNGNSGVLFPLNGRSGEGYKIEKQSVVTSALVGVAAGFVVSDGA